MKKWHAVLVWFVFFGVLLSTRYFVPDNTRYDSVFVEDSVSDITYHENGMEILINYKSGGVPFQLQLIKAYGENTRRAIVRTRMSEIGTDQSDIHKIRLAIEDLVGSKTDYQLGDSGYRIRMDGHPLYNPFESIIMGHGSYECIMFAGEWMIDKQNRLIVAKGSPTIDSNSPYSLGSRLVSSQNQQ